jgi:hypothetical protein
MADPHGRETEPPSEAFRKARELGHEPLEVSPRGLVIAGLAILLLVAVALVLMYGLFVGLERRHRPLAEQPPTDLQPQPGPPHVAPNQAEQLRQNRERWQAVLNSYQWVDQEQGIARIPIQRAIELVAEQGLSAPSNSEPPRNNQ